jgi:uncharacterized protein YlzI (FlbEa/FlbD family)
MSLLNVLAPERLVSMATRIVFLNGQETTVTQTEDEVVEAVRRDHPNPVKLEGVDGIVMFVNWGHITSIAPQPEPPLVS